MNLRANRYRPTIARCFEELQTYFTPEQALEVLIVLLSVEWIKNRKVICGDKIIEFKKLNEHDMIASNFVGVLKNEIALFEENNPLFKKILTSLIENVMNYPDINISKMFFNVYEIIRNSQYDSSEIKEMILIILSSEFEFNRFNDTPDSVIKLILELVDFNSTNEMAVFCCGYSKIALGIIENLKTIDGQKQINYYGEEIVLSISLISELLMIIFEIEGSTIENKDVLSFDEKRKDANKYDLVITDTPLIANSKSDMFDDPRLKYGIPTKNSAEWYFGQNTIFHMNEKGKGILLTTKGALVRSNETELRMRILEEDLLECVITLPNNLYEKSTLGTEMIILNKNKPESRKNKVLFINASEHGLRLNRLQHAITGEGINEIVNSYWNDVERDHFSKLVELEKIRAFKYKLNPAEYLDFDTLKDSLSETVLLKNIAQVIRGLNVKKETITDSFDEGLYVCLNIKDIENGKINYDNALRFQHVENDWINKYEIRPNDIVVTAKGWSFKFAIVEDYFKPSLISSNLTIIRVNSEKYNPYVLLEFFQSEIGSRMIDSLQTGSTVKVLNNSQLERFEIPMFDIENMNMIGSRIKRARAEHEESIKAANKKFDESKNEYTQLLNSFIQSERG